MASEAPSQPSAPPAPAAAASEATPQSATAAAPAAAASQPSTPQSWTLFVGQIPNDVGEDALKQLFSTYGLVTDCKILVDRPSRKPKGCAFLTYAEKQAAETAIATLHEKYTLPGAARPLIVRYSSKQLAAEKGEAGPFKLYISNLSKHTTEDEIRSMFSQFGQLIDDVVILKEQATGVSRGVAFVRYATRAEANAAIAALNEQIRDKDAKHLMQVKFAHTPSEKKQLMLKQMAMANGHLHAPGATPMGGYYPAHFSPAYASQAGYNPYMHPAPHHMGGYGYAMASSHGGHHSRAPKGPDGANLFVYGIPESYADADLQAMFASFGSCSAKVYRDLLTGKSKGFGFVHFERLEEAQAAMAAMDGYMVHGKKLTVKPKSEPGSAQHHQPHHHHAAAQQHGHMQAQMMHAPQQGMGMMMPPHAARGQQQQGQQFAQSFQPASAAAPQQGAQLQAQQGQQPVQSNQPQRYPNAY